MQAGLAVEPGLQPPRAVLGQRQHVRQSAQTGGLSGQGGGNYRRVEDRPQVDQAGGLRGRGGRRRRGHGRDYAEALADGRRDVRGRPGHGQVVAVQDTRLRFRRPEDRQKIRRRPGDLDQEPGARQGHRGDIETPGRFRTGRGGRTDLAARRPARPGLHVRPGVPLLPARRPGRHLEIPPETRRRLPLPARAELKKP